MLNVKSKGQNSQFVYNTLSTIIRSGLTFFTIPIFTRLLGAEQYGRYSVYASWVAIIVCFMGLNVGSGLGTGRYKFENDYFRFRNATLVQGTIFSFILILIGLVFSKQLGDIIGYSSFIIVLVLIEAFAQFVINFASNAWIYEKKAYSNMIVAIAVVLITSITSISFLVIIPDEFPELFYSRAIGTTFPQFIISIIIWWLLFKEKPALYEKKYWIYSLSFGISMMFHTLSHQVLSQSDRVMMSKMNISGIDIGIYSFFYTFVSVLTILLSALNNSWCPFLYDDLKLKNYEKINRRITNYVHIFVTICGGFLMLSKEVVTIFADNEYWTGRNLIPILVMVVYVTFVYQFSVNYEFFMAKPKIVAAGTACAAILNIVLNYLFIPVYGMFGAAIATLLSYIGLALFHMLIVKMWKYESYPLKMKSIICGGVILCFFVVGYYALSNVWPIRWFIGLVLGIQLIATVYKRKSIF